MRLIEKFLSNLSDQGAYLELLCGIENIKKFEIEDNDLLNCVKSNVSDSFKRIVNVGATGVSILSGTNLNNDTWFKFYRLFIKFAV